AQTARLESELAERQQVETALRDNERLLRNVLETLPVGVWVSGADGEIVLSNPASAAIWGSDQWPAFSEFETFSAWSVVTGERLRNEDWGITRALRHGESVLNELLDI